MEIILDFSGHRYLGEIYKTIKRGFDLPDEYGENLSALWDSLDGYCQEELFVYIKGINTLDNELYGEMKEILYVFEDVNAENPNITFIVIS